MKRFAGVWIDHKKAVVVRIIDGVEEVLSVESGIEKHVRYSGGKPEDQLEHRFTNHLKEYYSKVASFLQGADSIFILGPGEAKGEFEKSLSAGSFGGRIDGIETVDKMTDHEIAAKIREHFLNSVDEVQHNNKH